MIYKSFIMSNFKHRPIKYLGIFQSVKCKNDGKCPDEGSRIHL